jgi:hypothetical protein
MQINCTAHQRAEALILEHAALGKEVISQRNFTQRKHECSEEEQLFL